MAKKTVRILRQLPVEGVLYQPDQLVAFEAKEAAQYVKAGAADASKAAVAYCKGEGVEVITHEPTKAVKKAAEKTAAKAAEEEAAAKAAEEDTTTDTAGDGATGD